MTTDAPLHRQHAIGFIKHDGDKGDYVFEIPAQTELDGQKFVQRIRVELSRMRRYVRDQGMAVKPFRMKLVSIEVLNSAIPNFDTSTAKACKITLRKDAPDAQIARDVQGVFNDIASGKSQQ